VCGICGIVQLRGVPAPVVDPPILDAMTDAMRHRGPDDRGTYQSDGVALGVRRLSVVDVTGGHQPFANEDGTIWAIQNGELYNHVALRRDLESRGHRFRSRCDTEVLPHLYEQHGDDLVERLMGMFGLAVWDERRRRAIVARDRVGIKPLYYTVRGDLLVFASELKSVLASGFVEPRVDPAALEAYLTFGFVPGARTLLEGVHTLSPGHRLVVEDGRVSEEQYWEYPQPGPYLEKSADELGELLLDSLRVSVRDRLMSDVPLGAMLSGGLDSSLIVALMSEAREEPIDTFSIGFSGAHEANELADARAVSRALRTRHHEIELDSREPIALDDFVWYLDEPVADLSAVGFFHLSQLAAGHVTVALSGQGADELLGGYGRHRAAALTGQLARLPHPVVRAGLALAGTTSSRARRLAAGFSLSAEERLVSAYRNFDEDQYARLVGTLPRSLAQQGLALSGTRHPDGGDRLADLLYLDAQVGLVGDMLHYFDRMSMAHSLEVRVPFLDHRVIELCARIPTRLKVHGLTTKYLLRRIAHGRIPERVIRKRKIGFFNKGVAPWLQTAAADAVDGFLLSGQPAYGDLLSRAEVERVVARQRSGGDDRDTRLVFALLILEVWLASFLPRAVRAPAERPAVFLP
jgi:asparagine synthase (glutamine-hydrolysing)